jgi:AraC-like DNA-binding protein
MHAVDKLAAGPVAPATATIRWLRPALFRLLGLGFDTNPLAAQCGIEISSETVGDALRRYARFFSTGHDTASVELEEGGKQITLRFHIPGELAQTRCFTEWAVSLFCKALEAGPFKPVRPLRVDFMHKAAGPSDRYQRILGSEVVFGAAHTQLILSRDVLRLPLRTANPKLVPRLEALAEEQLPERRNPVALSAQVRMLLQAHLVRGALATSQTAKLLSLSERTLARRLRLEGTSHQEILDSLRADLAKRALADEQLTADALAARLGYAEMRSFQRAYKRWFGRSISGSKN